MIPLFQVNMAPDAGEAVAKTLQSGQLAAGPKVKAFEAALSSLWEPPGPVVATDSCTSALNIALRLTGVGPGDKVLMNPWSFHGTRAAVANTGASIVWSDTDVSCLGMSIPDEVPEGTKVILITLVGGAVPSGLNALIGKARQWGVRVILDAAHAFLTTYEDKHISHWGDYTCFSFQATKHLTTGDGGALVLRDSWEEERARRLTFFGLDRSIPDCQIADEPSEPGFKGAMNEIQATLGLANLAVAFEAVERSRENVAFFQKELTDGLRSCPLSVPSWWVWGIRLPSRKTVEDLREEGIQSSRLWKVKGGLFEMPSFPVWMPGALFVPTGFWVGEKEREVIVEALRGE